MEPWLNGIWPQTGLRPVSKLDSVMEFGRYSLACSEPVRSQLLASSEQVSVMEFGFKSLESFGLHRGHVVTVGAHRPRVPTAVRRLPDCQQLSRRHDHRLGLPGRLVSPVVGVLRGARDPRFAANVTVR